MTAKLDTATPLASVVINLFNLPGFDEVLWSKMVVRSGGWLIGHCVTKQQIQSLPQIRGQRPDKNLEEKLFKKLCGFREDETQVERQTRIGGIISLYFAICTSPKATRPLPLPFWPTKIWTFLARIMSDPRLLRQSMAPYVSKLPIYAKSCLHNPDTDLNQPNRNYSSCIAAWNQLRQRERRCLVDSG